MTYFTTFKTTIAVNQKNKISCVDLLEDEILNYRLLNASDNDN
jgi:hypothetical protein